MNWVSIQQQLLSILSRVWMPALEMVATMSTQSAVCVWCTLVYAVCLWCPCVCAVLFVIFMRVCRLLVMTMCVCRFARNIHACSPFFSWNPCLCRMSLFSFKMIWCTLNRKCKEMLEDVYGWYGCICICSKCGETRLARCDQRLRCDKWDMVKYAEIKQARNGLIWWERASEVSWDTAI